MVYQFECKCGARLQIVGKVRPVCRVCGAQMRLASKVKGENNGPVSYAQIQQFNLLNGYTSVARKEA